MTKKDNAMAESSAKALASRAKVKPRDFTDEEIMKLRRLVRHGATALDLAAVLDFPISLTTICDRMAKLGSRLHGSKKAHYGKGVSVSGYGMGVDDDYS